MADDEPAPATLMAPAGPAAEYLYSEQLALFGERRCIGFGTAGFQVREINRDDANRVIAANHYSRKFYNASYVHLGVFIDAALFGVLQFGYAMNPASQDSVVAGTEIDQYLELNRMWLDDAAPRNSESRAISYAIKFIRRALPRVRWIQSFADERCRLFGTVYQACNFVFCGEHMTTFWELDGVTYHASLMERSAALSKAAAKLQDGAARAVPIELRQFRYLYFMAPRFRRGLRYPILPFPKPNAARLSDEPVPTGASLEHTQGAAPSRHRRIAKPIDKPRGLL